MTTTILADDGSYCVRLVDSLPEKVKGMTVYDADGFANIYLNARLLYHERQSALRHELQHIRKDDVYNFSNICDVEND